MSAYITFLRQNTEPVLFGFLLTFFSSFGQTFLISLFVPFILADLALTNTSFGAYYAIATVISSVLMLRIGHIIDDRPVRPFTIQTSILLAGACLMLAVAWHPAVLFVALVGLRLGGQGLMSHISISTMSRYFSEDRGKALSVSSLGYSVGEMLFPAIIATFMGFFGWRMAAVACAVLVVGFMISLIWIRVERLDYVPGKGRIGKYIRPEHKLLKTSEEATEVEPVGKRKFYWQMLKESRFYVLALPSFFLSFTITGFFFYQYLLADLRGWPIGLYTMIFAGYGITRLIFSLYGGILADRYRTDYLYVYHLLPMALGVLSLAVIPGIVAAYAFLFLSGVTVGLGGVIKNAIVAEMYGVGRIGQVRSLFTMMMVISTAISPLLYGYLLDTGITFSQIAVGSSIALVLVSAHTFRIFGLKPREF